MKQNQFYEDIWMPVEFLADNSKAISAALRIVFPTVYRKNCFAHVIMMADKKMRQYHLTDVEKAVVMEDIHELSNISEEKMFDIAASAVARKWLNDFESEEAMDFANYFAQQYFEKDKRWFAQNGTSYRCNNGIEVTNKWIKVDFITQKAPLTRGITLLQKFMVRMRDKNFGAAEVRITDKDWVAAYDFKQTTSIIQDEDANLYYLRRSTSELNDDDFQALVDLLDSDVFTYEDVKKFQRNVVVVADSKVFDGIFTCSCPLGAQRKLCKHVIVIEVKRKRRKFTSIEARRQQLTDCGRNRCGRPKKHGPALSFD
jgi:predicted nucleic acid-binding Zn finger protein